MCGSLARDLWLSRWFQSRPEQEERPHVVGNQRIVAMKVYEIQNGWLSNGDCLRAGRNGMKLDESVRSVGGRELWLWRGGGGVLF